MALTDQDRQMLDGSINILKQMFLELRKLYLFSSLAEIS